MKANIRICLVGAGRVGKVHASSIMRHIPGGQAVALVDPAAEVLEATASQFGIEAVSPAWGRRWIRFLLTRWSSPPQLSPLRAGGAGGGSRQACLPGKTDGAQLDRV